MWRDLLKRRYARSIIIVFISIACNLSLLLAAARAEARPLLRVGIHQFGSDITEDSSGNFHGMETDFMQALGSYAGREVIFVPGTWEECQQRLEAGDIDVLAGVIKTQKRAETMLFSRLMMGRASDEANFHGELMPYRVNQLHFAVRRDNPELMRELDLAADQLIANRPYFVSHLYQIYYGQRGASELRLTEKEQRFLKRHPVISAVVIAREAPFAYVDEHGELQGTMRKLVDRLEHDLGIELHLVIEQDYASAYKDLGTGRAQILLNADWDVGWAAAHDMDLGDAFALPAAGDLLDLLHRVVPRFGASGRTAVGAETAVEDAAVRRLDVEIAVEVDLVAAHAPLALRRQLAQQPQGGFAPEPCGFGVADTRSAAYFGGYVVDLLHLIWGLSGRGRRR